MPESSRFLRALLEADVAEVRALLAKSPALAVARFDPRAQKNPPMLVAVRVPGFDGHGERIAPRQKRDAARAKIVALLVKHGADANQKYARGVTPLHMAARYGLARCIETLASLGADLNARNVEKETALFQAANLGHEGAVASLVKLGADAHVRNRQGQRAIDRARQKGFASIVRLLESAKTAGG